jgi:hypothetical protein
MGTITVKIKNRKKLQNFLDIINELDYVEVLPEKSNRSNKKEKGDFFSVAGMWENRDISLQIIREKAWRRN